MGEGETMVIGPGESRQDLYDLLPMPALDERALAVGRLRSDLAVLAAGWRARDWIERHADEQGVVFISTAGLAPCKPCGRYAVATLRGAPPEDALRLACDHLREMRRQALAAAALADKYASRPPAVAA